MQTFNEFNANFWTDYKKVFYIVHVGPDGSPDENVTFFYRKTTVK